MIDQPVSCAKTIGDLEAKSSEPALVSIPQKEKAEGLVTPPPSTDNPSDRSERKDSKMIFQKNLLSKKYLKIEKRILAAIHKGRGFVFFTILLCAITTARGKHAWSQEPAPRIDLGIIAMIESSGNPSAIGRTGDSGLFQITEPVRKEFNQRTGAHVSRQDLFNAKTSTKIADWYLHKRIPEMLRFFKKPVTTRNIIICWNAGVARVLTKKPLPTTTASFISKYLTAKGI